MRKNKIVDTMKQPIIPPTGWGSDTLSNFQETALRNEFATFDNFPEIYGLLAQIATSTGACAGYCVRNIPNRPEPSGALLLASAHSHYLATARLVTSGHCLAGFPSGRAAIEMALYAWYFTIYPDAADRWHNKPTEREPLRAWGNEFKFGTILAELAKLHQPLVGRIKYLHQLSIDFGAHPNTDALYSNMAKFPMPDGGARFDLRFLDPWGPVFSHSVKFLIETGLGILELFVCAEPGAAKELNMSATLEGLYTQFQVVRLQLEATMP